MKSRPGRTCATAASTHDQSVARSKIKKPRRGLSALPLLGDMLVFWRLLRDRDAHWGLKLVAFLTLAYVISPIDALPEAVAPVIGWIDDVGLVLAIRFLLATPLARYRYPLFGKPSRDASPSWSPDVASQNVVGQGFVGQPQ